MATEDEKELISRIDLIEYISKYIALKKKGNSYFGKCPFHSSESLDLHFSVNKEKKLFHCFACKASGNLLSFIKKIDNLSNNEAIEKLTQYQKSKEREEKIALKTSEYLNALSQGINPITMNPIIFENEESKEKMIKFYSYLKEKLIKS